MECWRERSREREDMGGLVQGDARRGGMAN
jgi:hypothetical protein